MLIPEVKSNMDGRYTCVYAATPNTLIVDQTTTSTNFINDSIPTTASLIQRRSFFIPYVISNIGFSRSAILTISISVAFALIFCIILLFDRYFRSSSKNKKDEFPQQQLKIYPIINDYGIYGDFSKNSSIDSPWRVSQPVIFDNDYEDEEEDNEYPDYSDEHIPDGRRQC